VAHEFVTRLRVTNADFGFQTTQVFRIRTKFAVQNVIVLCFTEKTNVKMISVVDLHGWVTTGSNFFY
jgi:hypothetical protein